MRKESSDSAHLLEDQFQQDEGKLWKDCGGSSERLLETCRRCPLRTVVLIFHNFLKSKVWHNEAGGLWKLGLGIAAPPKEIKTHSAVFITRNLNSYQTHLIVDLAPLMLFSMKSILKNYEIKLQN